MAEIFTSNHLPVLFPLDKGRDMNGDGFESLPVYSSVKALRDSGWVLFPLPSLVLFYSNQPSFSPMALSRIPLPSFTLALTSGSHSSHGYRYPTAFKLDSSASPAMLPTAPDHLMRTIDLRDGADDDTQTPLIMPVTHTDHGSIRLQTILEEEEEEEEESPISPAVEKQTARSTKQYVLIFLQTLRCKLFSKTKNISSSSL